MRLEDLYPNVLDLTPSEQQAFFFSYFQERDKELTTNAVVDPKVIKEPKTKAKKKDLLQLPPEACELLRKLGLI